VKIHAAAKTLRLAGLEKNILLAVSKTRSSLAAMKTNVRGVQSVPSLRTCSRKE
jgi:hypothetical protein